MIATTVDLRPSLLAIRDQGRRSTCLAFASSAAHEHRVGVKEPLSVEYLFFQSVARNNWANPNSGTTMAATAMALARDGQPFESSWPYQPIQLYSPDWSPPEIDTDLFKAKMTLDDPDCNTTISTLDSGRPVILGLVITDAFYRPNVDGIVEDCLPDTERVGHAVLAIGHGVGSGGSPFLLIRNSWGRDWGLDGHAWLSTNYIHRQLYETASLI